MLWSKIQAEAEDKLIDEPFCVTSYHVRISTSQSQYHDYDLSAFIQGRG